jgi:hypothetical protein
VATEDELTKIAIRFFKQINIYSQDEFVTDLNEIENWIRQDFISLDDSLLVCDAKPYGA